MNYCSAGMSSDDERGRADQKFARSLDTCVVIASRRVVPHRGRFHTQAQSAVGRKPRSFDTALSRVQLMGSVLVELVEAVRGESARLSPV